LENKTVPAPNALYVHIPFCQSICGYCDFCKLLINPKFVQAYLPALFDELDSYSIGKVDTIYLGGGTPTSLEDSDFEAVLAKLSPHLAPGGEFTVEANPESLSESKLVLMVKYGVNRLSIGMESADPGLLKRMGRHHDFAKVQKVVALAKAQGLTNLNVDLIYALPGETLELLQKDLQALLSLKVDHISTYSLILEDDSLFKKQGVHEASEDMQADSYELILKTLRAAGYTRYEVSNFARHGAYSRHNLVYWHDERYYGIGLGASGYIGNKRYTNTRSLTLYEQGKRIANEETVTPESDLSYYFLTHLRLEEGFSLDDFAAHFGFSFFSRYQKTYDKLTLEGLIVSNGGRIKPTDHGIMVLDDILRELLA
jgi:oxygen-independent coproporphyrinogen-3 oxidase